MTLLAVDKDKKFPVLFLRRYLAFCSGHQGLMTTISFGMGYFSWVVVVVYLLDDLSLPVYYLCVGFGVSPLRRDGAPGILPLVN